MKKICVICAIIFVFTLSQAKDKDVAIYKPHTTFSGKQDTILTTTFDIDHPRDPQAYQPVAHTVPIRQDTTGTCWCYSAMSLLESELVRLGKQETKLSRMYVVYHEYIEKARRFVRKKGDSYFAQGSQHNQVILRMKQYGIVRQSDYPGLRQGQSAHNHRDMTKEMKTYLEYVEENEFWNEEQVLANIRMILNRYMGTPPQMIQVNNTQMTPLQYLDYLDLPLDDYVSFISFKQFPFWTLHEYPVPDNWWHCPHYYNIPLGEFYTAIKNAIKAGYSVAIAGDVSEPGKYGEKDIAIVPSFDIPAKYIDQDSREFRFYNKTSTDDHGVHLIGYKKHKGEDWYLIKDSASSAWRGAFPGYHFFHQDYIRLKILAFLVHKDAVADLMNTFRTNMPDTVFNDIFDRGAHLFTQNYLTEAEQHYVEMSHLRPNDPGVYNNLGYVRMQQQKLDKAINTFHKVIAIDSSYAFAYNNLGEAILKKHPADSAKLDLALDYFWKALEQDSTAQKAFQNIFDFGVYKVQQGDIDEAEHIYKRLTIFQPQNSDIYNNLGFIYLMQDKLPQAEKSLKKAISLDDKNANAHSNYGQYLLKVSKPEKAIGEFEEALRINPALEQARAFLKKAKEQVLSPEEAEDTSTDS